VTATDLTGDSTTHFRTCPLCEATCGLEITMKGDSVGRIRGDRDDVFSHGFICPKGSTLKQLHEDPDRIRTPLIKRDGRWHEATWDEAYREIEQRLLPLLDAHGRDAVAIYLGNPNVHNHASTLYVRPLIMALGTTNIYSASTVDQMPKHVSAGLMFGDPLAIPVPDLDRTDYLLMLGANPWHSNGSLCTAPDFPGRLEAIRERGGRFVVVDPRRTRTAEEADEHLFIRPGTDAHWLFAIAHTLLADGLADPGDLAEHLDGLDRLDDLLAPFTPEAVAPICGIDADTTRRIAGELAAADAAAVYGRIGTHTVEFGTLASWIVDVVNALTGNLDRPGGAMFAYPAHAAPHSGTPGGRGFRTGRNHSRVKGHPEVRREYPIATLADEIETPGDGQVRALLTVAGNPALSAPDSGRLDAAFEQLDFMVSVDPYLNETTRHADVILPPPSPLAKSHYDLAFYGLSVRNVANYSPALVDHDGPDDADIFARLSLVVSGQGADADPAIIHTMVLDAMVTRAVGRDDSPLHGRDPSELTALVDRSRGPADQALDVMLRAGPYGDQFGAEPDGLSLDKLEANPHGIDLGPLTPQIPDALKTTTGKVELVPQPVVDDIPRLAATLGAHRNGSLVLVGRRHVRSNNSWMHNVDVLVKGKDRCTLHVHPDDADRLGLTDGGAARVCSRVGEVEAPVEVTDDILAGVVSLPHGWGHSRPGTRMQVAERHAGVNSNILTDGGRLDPLSGNAVLNAIPVTVEPAPARAD
jgi:anaerobic selenocysteine-containing dehydrogenase